MASEGSETSATPAKGSSNVEEKHLSYAKAVKNGASLSEHVLEKEMIGGVEVVNVPDEVIEDMVPLWDDLLEGRFLAPAPHVAKIHIIVNKIWPLGDQSIKIDVFPVNEVTVKFRIKDMATRKRILRRGMWNIANIPMVLSKWSPVVEEEEEEEIKVVPMWITMRNVPHKMFSWKGLGLIASAVGKPKRLHPDTILCTSFEEAKVFVEADMTKELPKSHRFKSKLGVDAEVEFIYTWLPDKCSICSKWGHTHKVCKSKVRLLTRQDDPEIVAKSVVPEEGVYEREVAKSTSGRTETEEAGYDPRRERSTKGSGKAPAETGESTSRVAEGNKITPTAESEQNWTEVSPSKQGRLGARPVAKTMHVVSPSRFAVLLGEGNSDDPEDKEKSEAPSGFDLRETEEGEILETPAVDSKEVSVEDSEEGTGDVSEEETEKDELVDQNLGIAGAIERTGRPPRSTVPRLSKSQLKSSKKLAALSTKEGLPSAAGKKRSQKKK